MLFVFVDALELRDLGFDWRPIRQRPRGRRRIILADAQALI